MGDIPIFVAHDSADVWAHRGMFKLDRRGQPRVVAGVPPDYFSKDGQRWGNPHYRWDKALDWWIARLERSLELFDAVRLDHFLGFLRAWEIPAKERTGRRGRFVGGPGARFFAAVKRRLGRLPLIAEDLGLLTPEAAALRDKLGLPGMRVLQFSFGANPEDRPHYFPRNSVVYTGTHDNDTVRGWLHAGGDDPERARRYAGVRRRDFHWGMIRVAHLAPSDLAIVPVQDLLGLGSGARMNRPGTAKENWHWRLKGGELTPRLARKLKEITETAGR
jgi:4-alpha-glucanotransferase